MGESTDGIQINRRAVLAAAAATGLVAACGADAGSGGADSGSGGTGSTDGGAATGAGETVATASEVPVGGGTINSQAQVVVTQPEQGDYRAFSSVCPHQGCQVSEVADNVITCRCHGSRFSAETGDVEAGPARTGLAPVSISVEGDDIVVS